MIRWAATAAATALAAVAPAADTDPLPGYAPAGPPVHCVHGIDLSPVALDRNYVGLSYSGRRRYLSHIDACPALEPISTLIVERYGGQLCDTDRFRVLRSGETIPSAYCRFGPFVPYDRTRR